MCRYSSVCGLGRDVPLLSPTSGVINGPHMYQTNVDPMVAMGTASAAPQKGGREKERDGGRGGGGEAECEMKNKRWGGGEQQRRSGGTGD